MYARGRIGVDTTATAPTLAPVMRWCMSNQHFSSLDNADDINYSACVWHDGDSRTAEAPTATAALCHAAHAAGVEGFEWR